MSEIERSLGYFSQDRQLGREINEQELNYLLNEAERKEELFAQSQSAEGLRNVPQFIEGRQANIDAENAATVAAAREKETGGVVTRVNEKGQLIQGTAPPKQPNSDEGRTLGQFDRAYYADIDIDAVEGEITQQLLSNVQLNWSPNLITPENFQKYRQAKNAFSTAYLRADSGAQVTEQEIEQANITYFPQVGDTAGTVIQKRNSRKAILSGLRTRSGNAYWAKYGENPDDVSTQIAISGDGVTGQPKASAKANKYVESLFNVK